nr:hypothetical transcript [Hymenolepis microstoma]
MPQREILKYLDLHSLVAFSQVCTEWRELAERCDCWEEASRSSNIPRCWYFEHANSDLSMQGTAHCTNPTHTWERAIRRVRAVECKWRSRDIEVREIANQTGVLRSLKWPMQKRFAKSIAKCVQQITDFVL